MYLWQVISVFFFPDINPRPDDKILGLPKLKAFADNIYVTQNDKVVFHRIEHIVEKEEDAG